MSRPPSQPQGPRLYVVAPGEDLSAIARRHGFSDWRPIYFAQCNYDLRLLRPDPDRVRAGDRLRIPPTPDEVMHALRQRLAGLHGVREEIDGMFARLEHDLGRTDRAFRSSTNAIEYVAKLFLTKVEVLKRGFGAMKAPGDLLGWANATLAGSTRELCYAPIRDLRIKRELDELGAGEGVQGALEPAADTLVALATPGFWAELYTNAWIGRQPAGAASGGWIGEARARLNAPRARVLDVLAAREEEADRHLALANDDVLLLYGGPAAANADRPS